MYEHEGYYQKFFLFGAYMLVEQVIKNLCEMFTERFVAWPQIAVPIYVESVAITGKLPGLRDSKYYREVPHAENDISR